MEKRGAERAESRAEGRRAWARLTSWQGGGGRRRAAAPGRSSGRGITPPTLTSFGTGRRERQELYPKQHGAKATRKHHEPLTLTASLRNKTAVEKVPLPQHAYPPTHPASVIPLAHRARLGTGVLQLLHAGCSLLMGDGREYSGPCDSALDGTAAVAAASTGHD